MGIIKYQQISVGVNGYHQVSTGINGYHQVSTGINGHHQISTGIWILNMTQVDQANSVTSVPQVIRTRGQRPQEMSG